MLLGRHAVVSSYFKQVTGPALASPRDMVNGGSRPPAARREPERPSPSLAYTPRRNAMSHASILGFPSSFA